MQRIKTKNPTHTENRCEFGNRNEEEKKKEQITIGSQKILRRSRQINPKSRENFQLNLYLDIINSQFNDKEMNGKVQSSKTDFSLYFIRFGRMQTDLHFDKCSQYFT